MVQKQSKSFRLDASDVAKVLELTAVIAPPLKLSETQVVEVAIRDLHAKHFGANAVGVVKPKGKK